jgi:solute carrier family 35 protein C2
MLSPMTSGLKNPLTLMSYVTPVMAVATALLSLALDPWEEFRVNVYFDSSWHIARSCLLMFFGGTLAFFMVGVYFPFDINTHIYAVLFFNFPYLSFCRY